MRWLLLLFLFLFLFFRPLRKILFLLLILLFQSCHYVTSFINSSIYRSIL